MRAAQIAARDTERRFPVRVRIAVPPAGLGKQLTQMQDWLDHNAGADGLGDDTEWRTRRTERRPLDPFGRRDDEERFCLPAGASGISPKRRTAYTESGRTSRNPASEPLITRRRSAALLARPAT
jgi:hypothetical protein